MVQMARQMIAKTQRNPARRSFSLVLLLGAGLLLAAAGCGGDKQPEAGQQAATLVPGGVQPADSTGFVDTAGDSLGLDEIGAEQPEAVLTPPPTATPTVRTTAPRTVDAARQAAPGGTFALQLGSFRNLDNARALSARVEALGYTPVLESAVVGGQTYHRVILRGLPDRAAAAGTGERLRAELGITYLIRQSD